MRPIDGDKLIEQANEDGAYGYVSVKEIADAPTIEQYGTWIPVTERLPEESLDSVIGWDEYRQKCAFVQYWRGHWRFTNLDYSVKITAWMQKPEAYRG